MEKKSKLWIVWAVFCVWDIISGFRKGFDAWRIVGIVLGLLILFCEFFQIAVQERD